MAVAGSQFELNLTKKSKKKKEKKPKKEKEPEPAPEPAAAPVEDAKAAQEARLAKMAAGPAPGVAEDGLAIQDEKTVDVSKLDPLTHEVSTRAQCWAQPEPRSARGWNCERRADSSSCLCRRSSPARRRSTSVRLVTWPTVRVRW